MLLDYKLALSPQIREILNPEVGDTVSVLMDSNDNWKTIINERTGNSATVDRVSRV